MTMLGRLIASRLAFMIASFVVVIIVAFPFAYTALFSFASTADIFSLDLKLVPEAFTTRNYEYALWRTNFLLYFRNSMIVSVATVILSVAIGALAGYALGCIGVPGKNVIAALFLFVYMLPSVLFLIPLYLLIVWLGIADTLLSLIVAYTTFAVPYTTWTLRTFFVGVPRELAESAMVDGCSEMGAFFRIILPLSLPGLASAAIFAFILAWNELLYALTFINTDAKKVVTIGIAAVLGEWATEVGALLAFTVLAGLPILIFFGVMNKLLIKGLTSGAVKG